MSAASYSSTSGTESATSNDSLPTAATTWNEAPRRLRNAETTTLVSSTTSGRFILVSDMIPDQAASLAMNTTRLRSAVALPLLLVAASVVSVPTQQAAPISPSLFAEMRWRNI